MFTSHSAGSKRSRYGLFTSAILGTLACSTVEMDPDVQTGASLREREAKTPQTIDIARADESDARAQADTTIDQGAVDHGTAEQELPAAQPRQDGMAAIKCDELMHADGASTIDAQGAVEEHVFDTERFNLIWGSGEQDIWALGEQGDRTHAQVQNAAFACEPTRFDAAVIARHYDGTEWSQVEFPADTAISDLHGSAADNVWAVGAYANAWHYDGKAWTRYDLSEAIDYVADSDPCSEVMLRSVWVNSETDAWAVGYARSGGELKGLLLHFDGESWTSEQTAGDEALHSVWASDADHVWVVGARGTVQSLSDKTWTRAPTMVEGDLVSVCGGSQKNVWVAGIEGAVLRYDGADWKVKDPEVPYMQTQSMTARAGAGLWMVNGSVNEQQAYVQSVEHWDGDRWCSVRTLSDTSRMLTELWVSPAGQVWAAGYGLVRFL